MLKSIYVFMLGLLTSLLHSAGSPVYIVGSQLKKKSTATLWIADTSSSSSQSVVLGNLSKSSNAYALTSTNNKIFCLGTEINGTNDITTLWITDNSESAPEVVYFENFNITSARNNIAAVNHNIFCAGNQTFNQKTQAALLVYNTSNQSQITHIFEGQSISLIEGLTATNDKIFCVGTQGNQDETQAIATLWITNTSGTLIRTIMLGNPQKLTTSIAVASANNQVFSLGYEFQENPLIFKPTLWITDTNGFNSKEILIQDLEGYTPSAIACQNNFVYLLSNQNGPETLKLSILDTSGTLIKSVDLEGSAGYSIQSLGKQIFAVGNQKINDQPTATLWVTDTLGSSISSYTIAPPLSNAHGLYIPQQEMPTLYQALQKFSPVHFQKGF